MSARKRAPRLIFYRRESDALRGVTVTECSVCVWDVVCWCDRYLADDHCSAADLIKTHAKFHNSVARIVAAVV